MKTIRFHVYGIVQGVGFRPFTAVTAARTGICGTVANKGSYVEIIAQGEEDALRSFVSEIRTNPPERAMILGTNEEEITDKINEFSSFSIIESEREYGDIFVSPDIAVCDKCSAELFDPANRRYLHPFINCTQCGPRLTILDAMPYDRERTSMKTFPMCPTCHAEYHDPATRRYDAQPVCCNDCGPEVWISGTDLRGGDAITAVRRAVMEGKIVAIKGIGGFHLCCNARNEAAVAALRQRKHRPQKPFALMLRDMDTVRHECTLEPGQAQMLTGWQKPVLLLKKRPDSTLSDSIAPDNDTIGVMLPYAPVQQLLFQYPDDVPMTDCLVMTSGNAKGAPICRSEADAVRELSGFCDLILTHDRELRIRADDSVCDWLDGKPYMIRRSRGFAPLPVMLPVSRHPNILAIGGELKNTFCVAKGGLLYASPYVGDMADIRTVHALKESAERLWTLLEAPPEIVVCDTHPMYNTVTVAQEIAQARGIPLVQVQHHYAHILSCMAENACTDRVIGLSLDGTGYGDDGTIWGGELLTCDMTGYVRAGSVRPFDQTGGDLSAKEGWRIAAAILRAAEPEHAAGLCEALALCTPEEYRLQTKMAQMRVNTVQSTSCGRIFDAVAAILGIRRAATFEGEPATALMTLAERFAARGTSPAQTLPADITVQDGFVTLETTALVHAIAMRYLQAPTDENRLLLAYQFHLSLSEMLTKACMEIRAASGISICALSGGVFQNRLLTKLTTHQLQSTGMTVLRHSLIPPNDGGIALGQAAATAFRTI